MKAIVVREFGDANQLVYEETSIPEPGLGEVRVKVAAIGLNFTDIYQRKGLYINPLPVILGNEFSGIIDALGDGVNDFQVGERVGTANGFGGYAEYAIASSSKLIHLPDDISFELSAALLLQGITAHYLARSTFVLKPGDTALIHAAAGGVGQLLVQIAKMNGANVIATVSDEEKAEIATKLGANSVILYTQCDFEAEVKRITAGLGVDVVYDGVGQATFMKGLDCLKPRGLMVLYGQASGPVAPFDPQILNKKGSLYLTRPTINHYLLSRSEVVQRSNDLFNWVRAEKLKVRIDQTFTLRDAKFAHEYMESRSTRGKVLIVP